jgi:hypothetical protein
MRKLLFMTAFVCASLTQAQNNPIGGRSAALGGSSSTFTDVWSAQNNQAGLGFITRNEVGAYYENRFLVKELSYSALAAAIPVRSNGAIGFTYTSFGYSVFRQTKAGLAYGMKFSNNFSAGLQLDYFSTRISDASNYYGKKGILTGELGFIAKLTKQVTFSAHIFNIIRSKLITYNNEILPVVIKAGMQYKISDKVLLVGEAEKSSYAKPNFKGGIEYSPAKDVYVRTGVNSNPVQMSFGAGMNYKGLKFDLSSSWHSVLGFSPQFGLSYRFGKEKDETKTTN